MFLQQKHKVSKSGKCGSNSIFIAVDIWEGSSSSVGMVGCDREEKEGNCESSGDVQRWWVASRRRREIRQQWGWEKRKREVVVAAL